MAKSASGKSGRETISLMGLIEMFSDEAAAASLFKEQRWPDGVRCVHCGLLRGLTRENRQADAVALQRLLQVLWRLHQFGHGRVIIVPAQMGNRDLCIGNQFEGRVQFETASRFGHHAEDSVVHGGPGP